MRILLVGAGGVGGGDRHDRRPPRVRRRVVVADYDLARASRRSPASATRDGSPRPQVDAPTRRPSAAPARGAPLRRAAQRHRSALRDAAVPGRAGGRRRLPGHGDVAVAPAPGRARTEQTGVKLGDEQFALAGAVGGGRAGWPWSGWASSRGCPTCSPGTPPTTCSARSTSSGVRDGANLTVAGYDFAPVVLHLDDDRGVPQPAGDLGARPRLVHHRAVQRARGVRLPRAASARSSASTWSTRRCC